jgi:hypothetical protein
VGSTPSMPIVLLHEPLIGSLSRVSDIDFACAFFPLFLLSAKVLYLY